jgi:uncharacterized surface anchored protein
MGAISENNGENPATVENWSNPVNRPQSMHVDANNNQRNTSTSDKCRQPPKLSPCKFLGKIEKLPKTGSMVFENLIVVGSFLNHVTLKPLQ